MVIEGKTERMSISTLAATVEDIKKISERIDQSYPLEYFFLDENFDKHYQSDKLVGKIFLYFSVLSILIACLGLLGLSSFIAEQRKKEIGIRKVTGASVLNVTFLMSKGFLKLVILSNIFSWPIVYFIMQKWLQNFAYRIDMSFEIFVAAGALVLLIALFTVSFQTFKAAIANPVDSLRSE